MSGNMRRRMQRRREDRQAAGATSDVLTWADLTGMSAEELAAVAAEMGLDATGGRLQVASRINRALKVAA